MKGAPYPERFLEACRLVLSIFGDGGAVTVTGTGPHLKQGTKLSVEEIGNQLAVEATGNQLAVEATGNQLAVEATGNKTISRGNREPTSSRGNREQN